MYVLCALLTLVMRRLLLELHRREESKQGTCAAQESQTPIPLPGLAAMLSARKTWDLGHTPCLQELWNSDISLDASSLDFLMSDCEEDTSFIPLQTPPYRRLLLTPDLAETNGRADPQLLIQALQSQVCELQASRRLLIPQQSEAAATGGDRRLSVGRDESLRSSRDGEQQTLIGQLRTQVGQLEEKLFRRCQEVERLRSELGATDLEKQLALLLSENERLKKELDSCRDNRDAGVPHNLAVQLVDGERGREDCQQVKYVTQRGEVDSLQAQQALAEAQTRNEHLQEQLGVQRELLHELENQLRESQRVSCQLRSQVLVYEGELSRARGQLEVEMQSLEEEKNRVIEEAFVRAESEMKAVHDNLAGVRMNLLTLQPALRTLTCDYNCLKRQVQDFPFLLESAIAEAKQEICQVIEEVNRTNQEVLHKYKREMSLRKKLHNELVRLKGNIRVFCRVRPVCREELNTEARNVVTFDPDDDASLCLLNKGKLMTFELDKVFPPQATQEQVFQEVQSLITSCIDGYNVCIFAYGQTGSGKTYTMEGAPDNPGINQRALQLLFSEVAEKQPDWHFTIAVRMVEIYNETLRDLLEENPSEKLEIKMCPDGSGQLHVPGLTEVPVQSVEDINKVFELGHMNRATACTNLNERSSRSHALLIVTVAGVNSTTSQRSTGKLNLVDLAGSERIARSGAEGSRLREAQCINKSLASLGDVIHALRSRQSHVPFRNSRLTYLLQDSLSGDSKTLMMVQVSPLDSNLSESVCSLKFAQRVRSVELGPAPATRKQPDNSSSSSSPTRDSVELDSPPSTPAPMPISRSSSAGSALMPGLPRRRSHSLLSSGRIKLAV